MNAKRKEYIARNHFHKIRCNRGLKPALFAYLVLLTDDMKFSRQFTSNAPISELQRMDSNAVVDCMHKALLLTQITQHEERLDEIVDELHSLQIHSYSKDETPEDDE